MTKLYAVPFSPYSAKVRSYLNYKQIDFEEVYATLYQFLKVIKPKTGVELIPVVQTDEGEYLQDSSNIIDYYESLDHSRSITPSGEKQRLASALLELYCDEWMVPYTCLHYRWNFPEQLDFILGEFGKMVLPSIAPLFARKAVGGKVADRIRTVLPKLGFNPDISQQIEVRHERLLELLNKHFENTPYLFGERASLGDFALFGPLYAHIYHDPVPNKLLKQSAPNVYSWVERMHARPEYHGEWTENDEVSPEVRELIDIVLSDCVPMQIAFYHRVEQRAKEHPGEVKLPPALSGMEFELNGVKNTRIVLSSPSWKFQRVLDCLKGISMDAKKDLLGASDNANLLMNFEPECRVTRIRNRVALDLEG